MKTKRKRNSTRDSNGHFIAGHKENLGSKRSLESRRKISDSRKGIVFSQKHIENLSSSHLGQPNKSKGKKRTDWLWTTESRKKASNSRKGCKSYLWKGGISSENKIIRSGIEWRLWREAVYSRDNWTCRKCFNKGGRLHPHHIKNFAQYDELRFAIDNGVTLCINCHTEFHRNYGKKDNNSDQLSEYINTNGKKN